MGADRGGGDMERHRRLIVHAFGYPSDVVRLERCEIAPPRAHEVRVRMRLAAINPSDLVTISGAYASRMRLPFVPSALMGSEPLRSSCHRADPFSPDRHRRRPRARRDRRRARHGRLLAIPMLMKAAVLGVPVFLGMLYAWLVFEGPFKAFDLAVAGGIFLAH